MEKMWSESELESRYTLFVFDLDGTLYDERAYLFGAYAQVAGYLATVCRDHTPGEYESYLKETFESEGRSRLFDKCMEHFHLNVDMTALLDILHSYGGPLQLYPQAKSLLDFLTAKGKKIYILTNGNGAQQRNKVNLLGLERLYPGIEVVYASAVEPKPSPLCLLQIIEKENIPAARTVLVGDTGVDAQTARAAQVDFIHIDKLYSKQCF